MTADRNTKPIEYAVCPRCLRSYPAFLLARHTRTCQGVSVALDDAYTVVGTQSAETGLKTPNTRDGVQP